MIIAKKITNPKSLVNSVKHSEGLTMNETTEEIGKHEKGLEFEKKVGCKLTWGVL